MKECNHLQNMIFNARVANLGDVITPAYILWQNRTLQREAIG